MFCYKQIKKIGQGQFGDVYLVQKVKSSSDTETPSSDSTDAQQLYAMKTISTQKITIDVQAQILESVNHPNCIKVYEVLRKRNQTKLILQFAEEGDLQSYLKRHHNYQPHDKSSSMVLLKKEQSEDVRMVGEEQLLKWLVQLCLVLHYLHTDLRIIHRDIKNNNILVTKNGLIKLGDFGIARRLAKHQQFAGTSVGTPCYLSPQIINLGKYDQKTDVWGLGCVMFEICTGHKPFYGKTLKELIKNITDNDCGEISEQNYSRSTISMIKSMLEKNPQKRPNVEQILQRKEIREAFERVKADFPVQYKHFPYPIPPTIRTSKYEERQQKLQLCLGSKTFKNMTIEPMSLKSFYSLKTAKNRENPINNPSNQLGKIQSEEKQTKSLQQNGSKLNAKGNKVEWKRFENRSLGSIISKSKKDKQKVTIQQNYSFLAKRDI